MQEATGREDDEEEKELEESEEKFFHVYVNALTSSVWDADLDGERVREVGVAQSW